MTNASRIGLSALFACLFLMTPALSAGGGGSSSESLDSFVTLPPFQVAILRGGRPIGVLVVEVGVEIPDPSDRARFQGAAPRLRDHMLRSLNAFSSSEAHIDKPINVARMVGRLQAVANSYAGKGKMQVLLVNVIAHKR